MKTLQYKIHVFRLIPLLHIIKKKLKKVLAYAWGAAVLVYLLIGHGKS